MYLTEEQKTIGRRNFLKAAAGVPALLALGGAAVRPQAIRGGPVKIAMIGTGGMGRELLTRYQKELCDLKAVCDVNPSRRGKVVELMIQNGWPQPRQYDDWRQMLQREDLDAVHVATPLWTHAEMTVTALNAGKHVLCEKMMAKSAAECQQMIDAATKNKRVVYRKYSEGLLCELGSHQLTATNWFFGATPEAVYTSAGTYQYKDGREVHDHIYAIFNYPGGRTATFSTIQSNAFEDSYEMFLGTKGTLILTHEADAFLFNEGNAGAPTRVETPPQSRPPQTDAPATPRTTSFDMSPARIASFRDEIAEFCIAVRTGSPVRCGPERAMKSAVAVLIGNRSAEKQTRLEIH